MTEELRKVQCGTHGEAYETYVCGHLCDDPVQRWFCDYPTQDDPWPDAICAECDAKYVKDGEWQDDLAEDAPIRLVCHCCYEQKRSESIQAFDYDALQRWNALLELAHAELQEKQDQLAAEFGINKHERFDWNQETGQLVFSNGGVPAVIAQIDFIGSVSTQSNTWLWAWANFHLLPSVSDAVKQVRELGETQGYPPLTTPKWEAEPVDGWEMAALAAHVLGSRGVYRSPGKTGFTFLAISDIRFAQ